jgi:hypothetical protein
MLASNLDFIGFKRSYMLPHLDSGWAVDQAVLSEEDRVVVIRFGHDDDETWYVALLLFFGVVSMRFVACTRRFLIRLTRRV